MPDALIHPTHQELADFGLGKLPNSAAADVAAHLESCPACRKAVANVSPDSFLGKLRAAGPDGSSFPPSLAKPGQTPSIAGNPAPLVPCPDVPPELARHPKFLILRELGRGGMGVVYQARQIMMNRQVVIKVINRSLLEQPGALERFCREVQAAAQLLHPNIVTAYDAEQACELHMLVMEFVPGQSLAEVLQKNGQLPVANACHYMRQVALGLQHAHERGMVHRDIKPSNLMLMPEGQVKILDFGLAKVISERGASKGLTSSDAYMGTPDYCAPEQATDARTADIRADLYSLGCTLYCLLGGRPPFQEDTAMKTVLAHLQKQPKPLPELRPDVPEELWQVVKRLLAKDPAQRYQKPIEVARALSVFVTPDVKGSPSPVKGVSSTKKGAIIAADTSQIKKVLREAPGHSPPKQMPAKDEKSLFENVENISAPPTKANGARQSKRWVQAKGYLRWAVLAGVGVLMLALVGMWARGVIKVKSKDGTIVLKNLPPDADVLVDGNTVIVNWGNGMTAEIRVSPGKKHRIQVEKEGFKVFGEEVEVDAGGSKPLLVRLEEQAPQPFPPKPPEPKPEPKKVDRNPRQAYKSVCGEWKIDGGDLVQESLFLECDLIFGDYAWKDYDFTCEVKMTTGGKQVHLLYRVTGAGRNKWVLGGWNNTRDCICVHDSGKRVEVKARGYTWEPNQWYKLTVRLRGEKVQCFVDDELVFDYEDENHLRGAVGFSTQAAAAHFRKIRVTDPSGKILFEGLPNLPKTVADQWFPATEPASASELKCLKGHGAPVSDVIFSRDGRQIVSVSNGRMWGDKIGPNEANVLNVSSASTLRLWDAETGKELDCSEIAPSPWLKNNLTRAPGSAQFATTFVEANSPGFNVGVRLWSIEDRKLKSQRLFPEEIAGYFDLSFTPDGRQALAVSETGTLREWDVKEKIRLREHTGMIQDVSCVTIAPNGKIALLARRNQPFAEIEFSTGEETSRWKETAGVIRSMAFSHDSKRVLTGSEDGTVRLWDVAKGEQVDLVGSHELAVNAVALSADGRRALSGSADQTVRLWDLEGKRELACFKGHTGGIGSVAFSPDGGRAASGSADYTVRLWRLP